MSTRAIGLSTLLSKITAGVADGQSITISEKDLVHLWPYLGEEKTNLCGAVHELADLNGWTVEISDPGLSATFQKR
ncbi:MAG: hypothetical protein QOD99_590 [Chthoniobacter sp.]|jgi:hypothetical protein|nr:hypothetical protein [Chthoniobacter sp.]